MPTLNRACSYCRAALPPREVPEGDPSAGQTSHGICGACLDDERHLRAPEREPWAEPLQVTDHEAAIILSALHRAARWCRDLAEKLDAEGDDRDFYLDDAQRMIALYVAFFRRRENRAARLLRESCQPPAPPTAVPDDQADALRRLVAKVAGRPE